MVVGVLTLRLAVFEAQSLKDKRRVVRSLKDRIAARHNVSIAEVDDQDRHQFATLGLAMVSNDPRFVQSALDRIVEEVRRSATAILLAHDVEIQ